MKLVFSSFALFVPVLILSGCFTNSCKSNAIVYQEEQILEIPKGLSIAVHYFSRSGNTKKVASAIARTLGLEAVSITTIDGINENIDILFLGVATYRNDVDKNVKNYISNLAQEKVKRVVVFSTAGANSAYPIVKALLDEKNIQVYEKNFFCRGQIFFENIGHPNQSDLDQAMLFTKETMKELSQ